jgi:cold shock CspA family protein
MSEQQTDDEGELATVVSWNGRYAFARLDRDGQDVYLGAPQLARAGIERLKIGQQLRFEVRPGTDGRKPWAARIRLAETTP